MKVYMIRHGETEWNKLRRMQGHSDIPLNEYGRELAIETEKGLRDIPFDVVYTSPLSRARETAELVLGEQEVPIVSDERIIELGFGEFEGLCCEKDNWNVPDPNFMDFFEDPEHYNPPAGGESFIQVTRRVADFLNDLFSNERLQDSNVLVASHGAAIKAMVNYIRHIPYEQFWKGGLHKNCAVTVVEVQDGTPKILKEGIVYYDDQE